jgi:hypothetical protein
MTFIYLDIIEKKIKEIDVSLCNKHYVHNHKSLWISYVCFFFLSF